MDSKPARLTGVPARRRELRSSGTSQRVGRGAGRESSQPRAAPHLPRLTLPGSSRDLPCLVWVALPKTLSRSPNTKLTNASVGRDATKPRSHHL